VPVRKLLQQFSDLSAISATAGKCCQKLSESFLPVFSRAKHNLAPPYTSNYKKEIHSFYQQLNQCPKKHNHRRRYKKPKASHTLVPLFLDKKRALLRITQLAVIRNNALLNN
jgi:hypothetical protein